jgi:hypothetical protein
MPFKTREEWLREGIVLIRDEVFKPTEFGKKLPNGILVSCGFPSKGAFASKRQVLGQCWYPSKKDPHNIFISPVLNDAVTVLDVLVHELCHTIAGAKAKHGGQFKRVAMAAGLSGKMTSTVAGPELRARLNDFSRALGKYPHSAVTAAMISRQPKQGTRLLKAECQLCGYLIRVTKTWADQGLPRCICGGFIELAE